MANKKPGSSPTLQGRSSLTFSENSSDIKNLVQASGIYNRNRMDRFNKFARFGVIDPYNALVRTKEYIFITKPDLCIFKPSGNGLNSAIANNAFFADGYERFRNVMAQWQSSYKQDGNTSPFMNLLSNTVTSSLDLPGLSASMIESAANVMGTKIQYRGTSIKSDEEGVSFSLEFEDNKYLDIYNLFKTYDNYEQLKWRGAISFETADGDRWKNYIINKVLHDQVTIYKFIVGEDGHRLIYWARIVGCTPTSIPRDAFSDTTDSVQQKLTIGWNGHFVRDMDPIILYQFNSIVSAAIGSKTTYDLPLFDTSTKSMEGNWASMPYIDIRTVTDPVRNENRKEYFLRWIR